MNIIDIVVLGLCVLFGALGIARGLVLQLFSIAGLIAGHLAGIRYYARAVSAMDLSFKYAEVAGYLVVFLGVYLVFRLAGGFIEGRIRASKLSGADRLGGMAAGLAKGALVSVLLVFLLVIVLPPDSRVLRESKVVPAAVAGARWLAKVFPDNFAGSFREKVRAAEKQPPGSSPSKK